MLYDIRSDFAIPIQITDNNGTPQTPDAAPTYRVYGVNGLVGSGTCTDLLTGTITGVTNANPAVVTDADHGLTSGTVIKITGVVGATGVNGSNLAITRLSSSTFSVPVAAGGAYVSGGTWKIVGAYYALVDGSLRASLEPGQSYFVIFDYQVSSDEVVQIKEFMAV